MRIARENQKAVLSLVLASTLATLLSGCAERPLLDDGTNIAPTVPLDKIINSLKCGLARAVAQDKGNYAGLYGATAQVILQVNLVRDQTAGFNGSATIPIYQGATVTPSFGFSHEDSRTFNTTINVNFDLSTRSDKICEKTGEPTLDAGFDRWLGSTVSDVYLSVAGPPKSSMQKYVYETDFVVTKKANAGVDAGVTIVPIKASASFSSTRQDIQHMTITINPVKYIKSKKIAGGGSIYHMHVHKDGQ